MLFLFKILKIRCMSLSPKAKRGPRYNIQVDTSTLDSLAFLHVLLEFPSTITPASIHFYSIYHRLDNLN